MKRVIPFLVVGFVAAIVVALAAIAKTNGWQATVEHLDDGYQATVEQAEALP